MNNNNNYSDEIRVYQCESRLRVNRSHLVWKSALQRPLILSDALTNFALSLHQQLPQIMQCTDTIHIH